MFFIFWVYASVISKNIPLANKAFQRKKRAAIICYEISDPINGKKFHSVIK
jgi:hypothetical protein